MNGRTVAAGLLMTLLPAALAAQDVPRTTVIAQVAPSPDQAASSAPQVTLDELIKEALAKNPAIQAAERRVAALRHRVPQAKTLPDPKVSVGWAGNIAPFDVQEGDPSSYRGITAMQEFPYPGKLKLRGQIADREVEAAYWEYTATSRRVVADVKAAYYDYYFVEKAIEITLKNKDLLEKLAKIAAVRYQVGKGVQQDVLRAQVEVSRLLQRLTILEQQKRTAQVRVNTLLFRDPESPIPSPAPFEKAVFAYTLDELYQLARQNDTDLQREQRMIERNQIAVNLARKEYYPDFSVGYMYQNRPRMPEMHGFTFTLNIPVFYRTKQREGVNEATQELLSTQRSRESRQTTLFFEVKEQYLAAKASEELAGLFSGAVVPQSALALESSMASYQVGTVDFLTMLNNFVTVLDYEIGYYESLTNYQKALARLEVFTGIDLTK